MENKDNIPWRARLILVVAIAIMAGPAFADEAIKLDPNLKAYAKVSGVSGNLNSIGSDTLNNLMTLWAEGFRKQYPNVKIQIEGKGSSTAPPALIEGTAQLGPMSRPMKESEIDKFESKFGYKPTAFPVAIDALAVYVNKDNPITGLTMAQVDAIFSKSRRLGHKETIQKWGQVPLKQEPVALAGLIDRTVGLLRPLIEQKQHRVVVEIPAELPPIRGDEERLGQVFSNLLDNAIKYTPEQGTITISAELGKGEVGVGGARVPVAPSNATGDGPPLTTIDISVADTGIGIPLQDLPRIFERFYRVDKARSRELGGTGLGLSIVKHLVEGHGGAVIVESLPGRGTKFLVRLPIATTPVLPYLT